MQLASEGLRAPSILQSCGRSTFLHRLSLKSGLKAPASSLSWNNQESFISSAFPKEICPEQNSEKQEKENVRTSISLIFLFIVMVYRIGLMRLKYKFIIDEYW